MNDENVDNDNGIVSAVLNPTMALVTSAEDSHNIDNIVINSTGLHLSQYLL